MQFFGIGTGELLLIFVVVLIIWGPDKIVEVARTLGRMFRTLKEASFDLTAKITKELEEQEPSRPRPKDK